MKITKDIQIKKAFRLGKPSDQSRRVLVRLKNQDNKFVVYRHSKHIKDTDIYVNDHLPEEKAELQRAMRQKIKYNKELIDAQQQDIRWRKGEVEVDGKKYQPLIEEPTAAQILTMKKTEIQDMLTYRVHEGDIINKKGSMFMGYAARVHSVDDVMTAYRQLKYRFIDATHIMCAYRIMDPDVFHYQDSSDGGEFGAGRRILQMMRDQSFKNCAAFVVRHHNGPNLGPVRFDIIVDAAKSALQTLPDALESCIASDCSNSTSFFNRPTHPTISRDHTSTAKHARGGSAVARKLNYARMIECPSHSDKTTPLTSVSV